MSRFAASLLAAALAATAWIVDALLGTGARGEPRAPLDAVIDKALVIYRLDGQPLPEKAGGPVRFFIPDFAACQTHEIDECANVKFVDRLELTAEKGFDNRPHDGDEHAALHAKDAAQKS